MTLPEPAVRSCESPAPTVGRGDVAWLELDDGTLVGGRGPFRHCAEPPRDQLAFYTNDFRLSDPTPWRVPAETVFSRAEAIASRSTAVRWQRPSPDAFAGAFGEISTAIRNGLLQKAVLAVTETGRLEGGAPSDLVEAALSHRDGGVSWSYAFQEGGSGFAGATPERLFQLQRGHLSTMALAGTAQPGERAGFEHDEKEIREHECVADLLRLKLAALGDTVSGPREVHNIGGLLHFLTRLEVSDVSAGPTEVIRALHPTPALGVMPRTPETLDLLQGWRRALDTPARFGAPFGVSWNGLVHVVVAIRGVIWEDDRIFLPAGCGIVDGSVCEREWREATLKREWVKTALRLDA